MKDKVELYHSIYKEIYELVGAEATEQIYERFKGQQISFPVRLFSPEMVQERVLSEYNGSNISELAKKYDYSEKTIRRMIKDGSK